MMSLEFRRWVPRLRVAAIAAIVAVLLFDIVGYLAITKIARWGVETVATRELGRTVRVQEITANPFNLRVTLRGLEVAGAAGETTPLLTVQELIANASVGSVLRLAPVLDALSISAGGVGKGSGARCAVTFSATISLIFTRSSLFSPLY